MPASDENARQTPEDLLLLQNGNLHLVRHAWALSRILTDLRALDYSS